MNRDPVSYGRRRSGGPRRRRSAPANKAGMPLCRAVSPGVNSRSGRGHSVPALASGG